MDLLSLAKLILGIWYVQYVGYLFLADLLSGAGVALATGTFDGQRLADWLHKLLPPLLGFAAVVLLCQAQPELQSTGHLIDVAGATVAISYLASILDNLRQLNIQVPQLSIKEPPFAPPNDKLPPRTTA